MTVNGRDRGATLPIVALLLPVLILMTAFAVDLGRQRSSRRTMQARADMIALDLVRLADDRTVSQIAAGDATHPSQDAALADSAGRNEIPVRQVVSIEWGTFSQVSGFVATAIVTAVPNAVRVTTSETTDYFFQPGSGDVTRQAVAITGDNASATTGDKAIAGFSVGSFGASLSAADAGLLNSLLTPLLGNPAGVSLLSYQGLATAHIAIAEIGAELGLVTPDEVLNTEVGADELMRAAATVLRRNGDATSMANASVLEGMASTAATQNMGTIRLGEIVSAGPGGETAAYGSTVDALSIVQAAAFLSTCTNPADPSTCSGIALPALTTTLPLLSTTGSVGIVQAPQSVWGGVAAHAETSQVATTLGSVVGARNVGSCVPSLANALCVLNGLLVGAVDVSVTVNATLQLADGEGTISAIECGSPLGLDILTTTGLYKAQLDVVVSFGRRGLLGGALGPVIGNLHLVGSTDQSNTAQTIAFDVPPDVLGSTTKQAGAGSVGLSTLALSASGGVSVLSTLATLGINLTAAQVLSNLVNPLLTTLDSQWLGPLTDVLGLNVIGADLTALDILCEDTLVALVG